MRAIEEKSPAAIRDPTIRGVDIADKVFCASAVNYLERCRFSVEIGDLRARLMNRARIDDNDEAISKRFDEYRKSTEPLLKWLSNNGVSVHNIDGERSPETVNEDIVQILSDS